MLGINLLNFNKNNVLGNNFKNNNYISNTNFKPNGQNLAPLTHDTISFSGAKTLNRGLLQAIENENECKELSENAKIVAMNLRRTLNRSLRPFVATEKNPNGSIFKISTRVKTPESIREKATSEFEDALNNDFSKIFNLKNGEEIKNAIGDIVGARIVLAKADTRQASRIINSLINEIKSGQLKITNIQNYCPEGMNENLRYFKDADLQRLADAANKYSKPGDTRVKVKNVSLPSGYMALHIDVDLSNPNLKSKNNGYKGEIQIIGYDVEALKEVEDFCYKLKQGKDIKGGHMAYKPFVQHFEKYLNNPENPKLKELFREYTSKAYLFQREKSGIVKGAKKKDGLPTIAQCGMTGKIPPQLDFNTLAKIKENCDNIYSLTYSQPVA